MFFLQSYPACCTSGPGAWGVCSSSARLRLGWRCRTAGLWCTGCPSGQRQLLWGSSGTCAPPAPVTPWGKRTWRAHDVGPCRWEGQCFQTERVILQRQRALSEVTTQNLSCSEIGTSCKKKCLREVTENENPSVFVIHLLREKEEKVNISLTVTSGLSSNRAAVT